METAPFEGAIQKLARQAVGHGVRHRQRQVEPGQVRCQGVLAAPEAHRAAEVSFVSRCIGRTWTHEFNTRRRVVHAGHQPANLHRTGKHDVDQKGRDIVVAEHGFGNHQLQVPVPLGVHGQQIAGAARKLQCQRDCIAQRGSGHQAQRHCAALGDPGVHAQCEAEVRRFQQAQGSPHHRVCLVGRDREPGHLQIVCHKSKTVEQSVGGDARPFSRSQQRNEVHRCDATGCSGGSDRARLPSRGN